MEYIVTVIPTRFGTLRYIARSLAYNENSRKYDRLFRFIK